MPELTTPGDLIALWPKPAVETFAADIGTTLARVFKWRTRKRVPPEYWLSIVCAAERRGLSAVTFEALASMHAKDMSVDEPAEARA
jgi:hypothetical protein